LRPLPRTILAGAVYWVIVFAFAFVLGALRVQVIAPRLGQVPAVLLETPVLLIASWLASRWTLSRLSVGPSAADRMAVGAVAFGLLMCAELGFSVFVFGRPAAEWLASLRTIPGAIGLGAQIAFGFVPLVQGATQRR
jgi:hypothetical protein